MDFIISFDKHLILIEAKAYTSYNNDQAERKLERLDLLREFYRGLDGTQQRPIEFHFLFASPNAPEKLRMARHVPWLPLKVHPPSGGVLQVTRCDENGNSSEKGADWRIIPGKTFNNTP